MRKLVTKTACRYYERDESFPIDDNTKRLPRYKSVYVYLSHDADVKWKHMIILCTELYIFTGFLLVLSLILLYLIC